MRTEDRGEFVNFLVRAKIDTYAGDGSLSLSSRPGSKDLQYREGAVRTVRGTGSGERAICPGRVFWPRRADGSP